MGLHREPAVVLCDFNFEILSSRLIGQIDGKNWQDEQKEDLKLKKLCAAL